MRSCRAVYDHLVTMTEHDHAKCGTGPEDCWQNPMGDPMVDWLTANQVDLRRIPMFPEIELLGPEIRIEYIYGLEDDTLTRSKLVLHKPATRMVRLRLLQEMPPELWEVYQRARADYRAQVALELLGRSGATVLAARPGSHIVLVTRAPLTEDDAYLAQASEILAEALPGVKVTIMAGVETILHAAAPRES
jgi:hypothetical protein